jgi:hypothetical protein
MSRAKIAAFQAPGLLMDYCILCDTRRARAGGLWMSELTFTRITSPHFLVPVVQCHLLNLLGGITPPNMSARRYSKRYCSYNGHCVHRTKVRSKEIKYSTTPKVVNYPVLAATAAVATAPNKDNLLCLLQKPIKKYPEGKTQTSKPSSPELMRWLNE